MKLSIVIALCSLICYIGGNDPPYCEFATPNKYIGFYFSDQGSTKVQPYSTILATDSECKRICRNEDKCYAASFLDPNQCSFYDIAELHIIHDSSPRKFHMWNPCDWTVSIEPDDGRCKGMFIKYFDNVINALHSYMILNMYNNMQAPKCLYKCLLHPLCKIVNYKESLDECSLHQAWIYSDSNQTSEQGTDLFKWTCIPDFEKNLQLPHERNILKCTGFWEITSYNATIPNKNNPGVYFFTQSYTVCLQECTKNPSCKVVLYNFTESICILPFTEAADRNLYLVTLSFIEFEWICLKNDSRHPKMNTKEQGYVNLGLECVQLLNNSDLYIAQEDCGHFPGINKFESCINMTKTRQWMTSDSCLVNQSFWRFKTENRNLTINGVSRSYITKIFTGLTSFWISHSKNNIFQNISFLECRRFDGAKSNEAIVFSDITTREQWYAYKSQGEILKFDRIPNHVVLSASQQPFYSCRTVNSCTSLLRNLQILYFNGVGKDSNISDIPYNFMLDESGNIYEGRGWKNKCEAVFNFNSISLCFGFIGRFVIIKPSVKFLKSIKKLIEYAVENKYLHKDYIVFIHQDATTHNISRNYAIVIKEWYRYRGFVPKDCSVVTLVGLILSGIIIIITVLLLIKMYKSIRSRKNCKLCEVLRLVEFKQIYPKTFNSNADDMKPMIGFTNNTKQCIVKERGSSYNQSKLIKLCQIWFLNKWMQSLSSKYLDYGLEDFLNTFQSYKKNVKVYEANINNYKGIMADNIHIVICFTNTHSLKLFEGLTANKLCICQNFDIDFVSFSELSFNII